MQESDQTKKEPYFKAMNTKGKYESPSNCAKNNTPGIIRPV
jgi:hypothetical protein